MRYPFFRSLFDTEFVNAVKNAIQAEEEMYAELGLYVAMLKFVGGSTPQAASLIERARKISGLETVAEKWKMDNFRPDAQRFEYPCQCKLWPAQLATEKLVRLPARGAVAD
ncbi:hypothetical protein PsorP6_003032 [Peronosclerospora sorghi]|uniref:Uncharacterized protein n=1 Tax=Peronosclerospora sorghi TaxID=230839 RepID=A0ACC0VQN0_9STRA|nr:hypothetical protein PsorP6_003032 [Peronosclerospora sorghi]